MPRGSLIQNTFNSGVWGRDMYGRTDLAKYDSAAHTIENFIVKPQGGLVRRSGYIYADTLSANSTGESRLIPFVFNQEQAYIIELYESGFRVLDNDGAEVLDVPGGDYPYLEAELGDIRYTQSADVLYLTHQNHPPGKINRTPGPVFAYEVIDFNDGPYDPINATETKFQVDVVGAAFGAVGYPTSGAIVTSDTASTFVSTDVGRHIRMLHGSIWGWAEITGFVLGFEDTQAEVTIYSPFGTSAVDTLFWRMSAWGDATDRLYPATVSFFEQRLAFANYPGGPNVWFASESVDFESFAPTTADNIQQESSSLGYSLYSNGVDAIEWMAPNRSLILGTSDGIWSAQATSFLDPITPGNIQMKPTARRGASSVEAVQIENLIFYASVANRRLNALVYEFSNDSYTPKEMTLANIDATAGMIERMAYEEEPHRILWVQRANGALSGLTVLREQEVAAWHNQTVGGSFGTGTTVIESHAVVPAPGNTSDRHFIIAKRTINGVTARYIEYRDVTFDDTTALEDGVFVDSAKTYSGVATTNPTGWAHLEGETVQVLADGASVADAVVAPGGGITIDVAASTVTAGLKYNSDIQTLNLNRPDPQGNSQGRQSVRSKLTTRVLDTVAGKYGPSFDNLTPIRYVDQGPYLFSGDVELDFEDFWADAEQYVCIRQDQPYPMTISALMLEYLGSEF